LERPENAAIRQLRQAVDDKNQPILDETSWQRLAVDDRSLSLKRSSTSGWTGTSDAIGSATFRSESTIPQADGTTAKSVHVMGMTLAKN
jgi:hypothetical protein